MTLDNDLMNEEHNLEAEMDDGEPDPNGEEEDGSEIEAPDDESEDDAPLGLGEASEWVGLTNHPTTTATRIVQGLRKVANRGKTSLTVLVIGRAGSGKSTTVNSLFASDVVELPNYGEILQERPHPVVVRKRKNGVCFTVVDAQGLVETDAVSETGLKRIAFHTKNQPVDVVMFIDRFDIPKPDELDFQIFCRLTRTFGRDIWSRMIIGLTRADVRELLPGQSYGTLVNDRVEGLRDLMKKAGGGDVEIPYVLIENSEHCLRNPNGEKVLQNGDAWIPLMFEKIVEVAQRFPDAYRYNPRTVHQKENFITKFCIIPLVLFAQIVFKVFILDRVIREDGFKGDRYGPFDAEESNRVRERYKARSEAEKKRERQRGRSKYQSKNELTLEDELSEDSDEDLSDNEI